MKKLRGILPLFFALLLFGCVTSSPAGLPFKRLSNDQFELGKTTRAEIEAIMGKPGRGTKSVSNGKTINTTQYDYVSRSPNNQLLVKVQNFFFYKNVLVGQFYSSNFEQDSTDFDDEQIESIQKGKTKIDEVIKKLGAPSGEAMYPLTGSEDEQKLMYFYPKSHDNATFYTKEATIFYKSNGIVSNITFTDHFPAEN